MISCHRAPHRVLSYLECSSRGDKRFSAFYARLERWGDRSIEDLYQASKLFDDGSSGLGWRAAKGRQCVNQEEVRQLYSALWDQYIAENPILLEVLRAATGLSDTFGQEGHACQATELWRIRNHLADQPTNGNTNGNTNG